MDFTKLLEQKIKEQKEKNTDTTVMDDIKGLTERVNPPKPEFESESEPESKPAKNSGKESAPKKRYTNFKKCPHCGKEFLRLGRHISACAKASESIKEDVEKLKQSMSEEVKEGEEVADKPKDKTLETRMDSEKKPNYQLFIDVTITTKSQLKSPIIHLIDIIGPMMDAVREENKVPYWSTVEFGRGPGLLAAKLESWINNNAPHGIIIANSQTLEGRACVEVLKRYANNIVQGIN
jgi:predicted RNA-binding Zn-ribbon protein involved in translation (DUF1610 family)